MGWRLLELRGRTRGNRKDLGREEMAGILACFFPLCNLINVIGRPGISSGRHQSVGFRFLYLNERSAGIKSSRGILEFSFYALKRFKGNA